MEISSVLSHSHGDHLSDICSQAVMDPGLQRNPLPLCQLDVESKLCHHLAISCLIEVPI